MLAGREFLISELLTVLEAGIAVAKRLGDVGAAAQLSTLLIEADHRFQVEQFADPAPIYTKEDPFFRRIEGALGRIGNDPDFAAAIADLGAITAPKANKGYPFLLFLGLGALGAAAYLAWELGERRGRR